MLQRTTFVLVVVALISSQGAAAPTTHDNLKVVVINAKPFSFLDVENAESDDEAKYAGVFIDIFKDIANRLNYSYEFYQVPDSKYGYLDDSGQWHGLIKELLDGNADVAVAPLTITADRAKVVRFGRPLMTDSIVQMIKRPAPGQPLPFTSTAELLGTDLLYGAVKDGSTYQYFVNAPNGSVDSLIGQQMIARSDEVLARSYEEGVKRVREGGYVFFGEQYSLELLASRAPCNLMLVGDNSITARHYAFAFRKEATQLSDRFDQALIEQESDVNKMTKKYWEPQCVKPHTCVCAKDSHVSSEMSEEDGGKKYSKQTAQEKIDDDSEEEEERKEDKAGHEQKTTQQTDQAVPSEEKHEEDQPQTGDDNETEQITQESVTEEKNEESEQPVESDSATPASEEPAEPNDNSEPSAAAEPDEPTAENAEEITENDEQAAQVEEKEETTETTKNDEAADTAENEVAAEAEGNEPNAETVENEQTTETPNATESANDEITATDSINETSSSETTTDTQ